MSEECDHLDAYFFGDLDATASERFESHASECPACREAIDEQRWIDSLLVSPLRLDLEAPSQAVIVAIGAALKTSQPAPRAKTRRSARLIACGFAAVAALLVAATWALLVNRQADRRTAPDAAKLASQFDLEETSRDVAAISPPRATFVGTGDTIAVPVESAEPDVTVFRLYSAYRPQYSATVAIDQEPSFTEAGLPN